MFKVQCCVCKKVRVGESWRPPRGLIGAHDRISHGYCPTCAAEAFEQIRRETLESSFRRASVASVA